MIIKNAGQNDNSKLCIISYNSRGFSSEKQDFCQLLTSKTVVGNNLPILCNQENFVLRGNSYKINQALKGYHCIINPAIKETHDKGRARNGMFIAVPDCMKSRDNNVSPGFWRVQAITIKSSSSTLLLINTYFPNDPRTANFDDSELMETFAHIKRVIETNECDLIVFCGDINSDFKRNSGFVQSVRNQVEDMSLDTAWRTHEVGFTFVYNDADDNSHTAVLDHFFLNETTQRAVLDAGVIHLPDNMSDHCPIFCTLDVQSIEVDKSSNPQAENPPKPSWKKASEEEKENYIQSLEEQLSSLHVPESLYCKNIKCQDANHCNDADDFITSILEFVQSSATSSLPSPAPPRASTTSKRPVPGWNQFVKPFRDTAYFWHQVWISAGRPLNTELHRIMKRTRNLYHYHYRKCKKAEEKIVKNKLLDACINGQGDIFKEIKKIRAHKPVLAASMDGEKDDIAGHFKNIYSTLYNSTNDQDELKKVAEETESQLSECH